MKRFAIGATLTGILAAFASSHAPAAPVEAYGNLPNLENIALSPDGSMVAFVRTEGDQRVVAVVSLSTGKLLTGIRASDAKLRSLEWADDRRLLIVTSTTAKIWTLTGPRREYFQLVVFDINTQKTIALPARMPRVPMVNVITRSPMVRQLDGHTVLFIPGMYVTDRTLPALFSYDLDTGKQEFVEAGSEETRQWFVDEAGKVAARVDYVESKQTWHVAVRIEDRLERVLSGVSPIDIPLIHGFGPRANTLLVTSLEDDTPVWRTLPLSLDALPAQNPDLSDVDDIIENPRTRYLVGGAHVVDHTHYRFFEPPIQKAWDSILAAYPGDRVRLESFSANFEKVIVRVDGSKSGYKFMLVDTRAGKAKPFGPVYDAITDRHETQRITYAAADGLEIPAYLTLPAGKSPTKLPLVVLPHGGPAARDTSDFDWWTQALAAQGYAVLQPNYRGSAVDWKFTTAGFGEWGRKMQTDLSDGVRHLAKEGLIDPSRVCIVGASYGGYAALAGVTLDPGVYRCAVSVAGLSDLPRFREWVEKKTGAGDNTTRRYWDRFMGGSGAKDALRMISPAAHAEAVNVPVLLIHGRDDTIVPFEQSDVMHRALKRAKKTVEIVPLKREDHWLSRGETRVQMLQSSVAFLRAHNPPE
jgi:dipeptidyl aminopeptidase/acylaminoacyl peptidase